MLICSTDLENEQFFKNIYDRIENNFMVKDFPISPLEKLMRNAGAERVSASALKELKLVLLEIADKIALEAVAASHHAKRVTVKREDVILATRR